jgi:hypothetical protein
VMFLNYHWQYIHQQSYFDSRPPSNLFLEEGAGVWSPWRISLECVMWADVGYRYYFVLSWFLLNDDVVSIFCICTVDEAAVDEMKAHLLDRRCKYRSFQTEIDARTK